MRRTLLSAISPFLLLPATVLAQNGKAHSDAMMRSARSAAIASVADKATVMDHAGNVLHKGTNGWVCMPDMPDAPNNSPMCLDDQWLKWMDAYMNKREPEIARVGVVTAEPGRQWPSLGRLAGQHGAAPWRQYRTPRFRDLRSGARRSRYELSNRCWMLSSPRGRPAV